MSAQVRKPNRIQKNQDDSLLKERLKIANVILPEDNLEDLVQLPIAPELISRKLRAKRENNSNQHTPIPASHHRLPSSHNHHNNPLEELEQDQAYQDLDNHLQQSEKAQQERQRRQLEQQQRQNDLFFDRQGHNQVDYHQDRTLNSTKQPTPDSSMSSSDEDHLSVRHPQTPLGLSSSSSSQPQPPNSKLLSSQLLSSSIQTCSNLQPQSLISPTPAQTPQLSSYTNSDPCSSQKNSSEFSPSKHSGIPQRSKIPQSLSRPSLSNEPLPQLSPEPTQQRKRSETSGQPSSQPSKSNQFNKRINSNISPNIPHPKSAPISQTYPRKRTTSAAHPRINTNLKSTAQSISSKDSRDLNKNRKASDPSQTRTKAGRERPRSASASSLETPLPPWSTDPGPRMYRVDPQSRDAAPRFDDLILPAVARKLEQEKNLVVLDSLSKQTKPTMTEVSEWGSLGTRGPVLVRRGTERKPIDGKSRAEPLPNSGIIPSLPILELESEEDLGNSNEKKKSMEHNNMTRNQGMQEIRTNPIITTESNSLARNGEGIGGNDNDNEKMRKVNENRSSIINVNGQERSDARQAQQQRQEQIGRAREEEEESELERQRNKISNGSNDYDEDNHGGGCCNCIIS